MTIAFRVDASVQIGMGHLMRCLTLAEALRERNVACHFICRALPGSPLGIVTDRGFDLHRLSAPVSSWESEDTMDPEGYANWLGCPIEIDARETGSILERLHPDWLVVDHYAIDTQWESFQKPLCRRVMVIDDLANRLHNCELLLDQTFGRETRDYLPLVPPAAELLCGSHYALLRQEFAHKRQAALARRATGSVDRILISLGGIDAANVTGTIIEQLDAMQFPQRCRFLVVMGSQAPHLKDVRRAAQASRHDVNVIVNADNMAELMSACDLAIGAAGATAWERCCLGLPTIMIVIASNQRDIAEALAGAGAAEVIYQGERLDEVFSPRLERLIEDGEIRQEMSAAAALITDGGGTLRAVERMGY